MKTKMFFFTIAALLLFAGGAGAQVVLTAQEAALSEQDKAALDRHLKSYTVFTLDTSELLDSLRTHEYCNVQLYINEQWNWSFYLKVDKRWTGEDPNSVRICDGKTSRNEDVLFGVGENFLYSTIYSNEGGIAIRMARHYTQNFADKSFILHRLVDVIDISIDKTETEWERFSVYPNPASDKLFIECNRSENENLVVSVFDGQGRIVRIHKFTGLSNILSLAELSTGIYFVRVVLPDSGISRTTRVVVVK